MRVRFVKSEPVADHIHTFYFRPKADDFRVNHVAGQFIELRVPHDDRDNRGDRRWFTLSNSPTEDMYAITTKFAAVDSSSFKDALKALQPGTEVDMAAPMGDFVLPKDTTIPLTFIAGGIGITPFRSMIRYAVDNAEKRNITLLYAARNADEIAFKPSLDVQGVSFKPVTGNQLSIDTIVETSKPDAGYVYLSGPEPMVQKLQKDLKAAGFDKRSIQTDYFPGYTDL